MLLRTTNDLKLLCCSYIIPSNSRIKVLSQSSPNRMYIEWNEPNRTTIHKVKLSSLRMALSEKDRMLLDNTNEKH